MAFVLADRVLETSTSTGTGSFVLAGARDGYQSFTDALANGDTTYYTITDGTDWEVGLGTWTESTVTLARTTVISSSNSGSAVDFGAGTKEVFITYPANKFGQLSEDTSPQLGGDLDTNSNHIYLDQLHYVKFDGDSFNYWMGYGSYANNIASRNRALDLIVGSASVSQTLNVNTGTYTSGHKTAASFSPHSAQYLYYNNVQKFVTTSTGIDVTGEVQCDSLDVDGTIDLDTTSTGAAIHARVFTATVGSVTGPNIELNRSTTDYSTGEKQGGGIYFGHRHQYAEFTATAIRSVRTSASVPGYGSALKFENADITSTALVERMRMSPSGIIINETGDAGTDFRVESDSNQSMLFVDASADAIGINNSSPSCELDVTGTIKEDGVTIKARALVMALAFG